MIRILTVDDHPMLREGIAAVLASEQDMTLVAEASNGREAVEQFRAHHPDVTLMDVQMPEVNGIDAIVKIREEFPDARIIVLTTYTGDVQAARAFKAGASGYMLKNMVRKELIDTIRTVHAGKKRIPAEIAVEIAQHHSDDALTEREIEVLREVAATGVRYDEHATSYFLSRVRAVVTDRPGMARWRKRLYGLLANYAQPAAANYRIPSEQVFEVVLQVEV